MQLAGALTGDFGAGDALTFAGGRAHLDQVTLVGVFTRRRVGIAARHGCRPAGPVRLVTRTDGRWLLALDGRRAIDAWLADVRAAEGRPPATDRELLLYLANSWELGLPASPHLEPPVRAPMALRSDGAVLLSAAVAEGTRVRVMRALGREMLDAAAEAAELARQRAGGGASGALLLACSGRRAVLGERFVEEQQAVSRVLGAPVAGACVFGEIARAHREVDAFHNTTAVVLAWPRSSEHDAQ
jgi:hypothetical protein